MVSWSHVGHLFIAKYDHQEEIRRTDIQGCGCENAWAPFAGLEVASGGRSVISCDQVLLAEAMGGNVAIESSGVLQD